jgi:2-alkyl-3-oxoalkanoate reductase
MTLTTGIPPQKVLVTGANGFLGSALTRRLAENGVQVMALVRDPMRAQHLQALPNVSLVVGDIRDADLAAYMVSCDYVFHVAAQLNGSLESQMRTNADGTERVALAAAQTEVKRLVHVSSLAAYGYGYHSGQIGEDTPLKPVHDPYSMSKAEAERRLGQVAQRTQLAYSIVRPGGIYGPGSGFWTATMFKLAARKPTVFIGSGNGYVPLIFVDDLLDLMLLAAEHPQAAGEAFNAVYDPPYLWRQFWQGYSRLAGHDSWLGIPVPLARFAIQLIGLFAQANTQMKELPNLLKLMTSHVQYPTGKARRLLGWQPQIDLQTGIGRCKPWLQSEGLLK